MTETNRESPFHDLSVASVNAKSSRSSEGGDWMTPFEGSGIAWHESLPSPYEYRASDFSKLVAAVHEYECALVAAQHEVRV